MYESSVTGPSLYGLTSSAMLGTATPNTITPSSRVLNECMTSPSFLHRHRSAAQHYFHVQDVSKRSHGAKRLPHVHPYTCCASCRCAVSALRDRALFLLCRIVL